MLRFITHKPLWLNVLVGILLAIFIFSIFLLSLNWLTRHGKATMVPSVTGKKYDEARKILHKAGFDVDIQDSIYIDSLPPMAVIKQIPDADELVKSSRTVYLVINRSVPPLVPMPNLVGYSFRNAEMVLKNMDLRIGDTTFKPDFAKNSVLQQYYNGSEIKPGTAIRKGSLISLVLGDGVGNSEFSVPVLIGMSFREARERLEANGLGIGAIVLEPDVKDTLSAYIYRQNPERFDEDGNIQHIRSGQLMDVWLQLEKPVRDTTRVPVQEKPSNNK
ncbi:MAG TPA: PASTA domain-containing protein [Chitinophagaceae bacterium]|nr:PASTA domain-containing protein [Chitinophagaceae bacterium]